MHPGSPLYNMILLFRIDGAVDIDAFRRAFFAVAHASDVLTAAFDNLGANPQLQSGTAIDFFDFVDLSNRPDSEAALQAWVNERKKLGLKLDESLIDSALIRVSDLSYAWYFNAHHLVTDGWSAGVVFNRVQERYEKELAGTVTAPLELPPYAALIEFEKKITGTPRHERAIGYWDKMAASTFMAPRLYGRETSLRTTNSDRRTVRLSAKRMTQLRALASHEQVRGFTEELSFHSVILSILGVFITRVSGTTDFAISMPTHNRHSAGHRNTIGVFVELFPVLMIIEPDSIFLDVIASVRERAQRTFQHALPGLGRPELNRRSVVALNYVNATFGSFAGLPVRTEWVHCDHFDSNHAMRLHVHDFDGSGELVLQFDFATDVFSADQQHDAIEHFMRLFDSFVEDPHQAIGRPSLMDASESALVAFDADIARLTAPQVADESSRVLSRFLAVVRDTPNSTAVTDERDECTYADLLKRAQQIGSQLEAAGVAPGQRVGIYLERGIDFIASIIGCMLCGVAYVPIERSKAIERAKAILRQCAPSAIITDGDEDLNLPAPVIRVGSAGQSGGAGIAGGSGRAGSPARAGSSGRAGSPGSSGRAGVAGRAGRERTVGRAEPIGEPIDTPSQLGPSRSERDDAAYVIFTSGSTGVPKGVVVQHGALARYVDWASKAFSRPGPTSMPLFTSLSYDLAVTSVFVPLVTGGTIRIYRSSDPLGDASLVRRVLSVDKHDVVKLTPSHLLVAADVSPQLSRLQSLVLGGEALTTDLATLFHDKFGGRVRIINEYGPTEATVGCMIHDYASGDNVASMVPIGKPNPYSEILLIDPFGNSVPDGVAAELVIGGAGLASGYLNNPEATATSFVPHPHLSGVRVYHTGDAAVRDASGIITYLGRIDEQIKISGVRLEPAEIEARISELEGISGVAVLVDQPESIQSVGTEAHCVRCGLTTDHPATTLDGEGICNVCRRFDQYKSRATSYFRQPPELERLFSESRVANPGANHDCLVLLSGGKDSTYVLGQLVDLGLRVHAFTLDNGFLSVEAKANIRRVVEHLGVPHEFGHTEAMNEIFVDSLRRYSNVCNGCFKTIYTLALKRAEELSIPIIVTGLSRGQFFETRLTPELFESVENPLDQIDDTVLAARKSYHKVDDAVRKNLDTAFLRDGELLDEIRFVDFFRYTDVSLDQMLTYLDERLPWIRPSDTGRSTNCLINDAGIFVHKRERGYHNYAWPYSWDVRVGHKQRDAALDELDDQIDEERTLAILDEIGYTVRRVHAKSTSASLHAYYVAADEVTNQIFRKELSKSLPHQAIPSSFTRVNAIPLTANGKVDRKCLAESRTSVGASGIVSPQGEIERIVHDIWCELLGTKQVSTDAAFLDNGGSSILGIQVISRVSHAFEITLPFTAAFQAPTIIELSALVETTLMAELESAASSAKSEKNETQ